MIHPVKKLAVATSFAVTVLMLTADVALACPVCFGQSDSPMAQATNLGVLFLLGVVAFVLVSFGAFFIYLARRARVVARLQTLHAEDPLSCSNS